MFSLLHKAPTVTAYRECIGILQSSLKMSGEPANGCLVPTQRKGKLSKHTELVSAANSCFHCDVLYLGDSIVEALTFTNIYKKYGPRGVISLNFGIGGDLVEHVLYRIQDGDWLARLKPTVVVLFVGTNNTSSRPIHIAAGIENIVENIRNKSPESKVILPLLHPKGLTANKYRALCADTNRLLSERYSADAEIHLVDTAWDKFIDKAGVISTQLMYDSLHLTEEGYGLGWKPVLEKVKELLR